MKTAPFLEGVAIVVVLVTAGLVSICNAQPQGRDRQHGDTHVRIVEKPTASSASSFFRGAPDSSPSVLARPGKTVIRNGCNGQDRDTLDTTHDSEVFTQVEPELHADSHTLNLSPIPAAILPTRRRLHRQISLTSSNIASPTGIEHVSVSASVQLTKSSSAVIIPSAASLPSPTFAIDIENALDEKIVNNVRVQQHPVYGTPESQHHPNIVLPRQDNGYQSFVLGGFSSPTSSAAAPGVSPLSVCPASNGTTFTSAAGIDYEIVCDVDYPDNDHPFELVDSFAGCVQKCDAYNFNHHHVQCFAALFVPSREGYANDCYLKSSTANPRAATLQIQGAVRLGYAKSSTSPSAPVLSPASAEIASMTAYGGGPGLSFTTTSTFLTTPSNTSPISVSNPPSESNISTPGVTYASGDSVVDPKVISSHLHGPTQNMPTKQYLDVKAPPSITLPKSLLKVGVNSNLTTGYGLSPETGVLQVNSSTQAYLSPITGSTHLSRDGGKGGMISGEHLFIFCDTGSYSTTTSNTKGKFLGFVSSSVAIDVGMNGLNGKALHLQDGIGEWSDNVGRMRGFAPLTIGEVAYNLAMQGQGQRYAVWPESSLIPLDAKTGMIYAPVVYDNVNEETKAAVFTYTGTTLLTITAGGKGGPIAQRSVDKIFDQDEVEWGCAGGIRGWGASGIGGNDGYVYLFGRVGGGILLARVSPADIADRDSFEYWDGSAWTSDMQPSTSKTYFIEGSFMDVDLFYSPRYLTFIIVYMTSYADSTFYYRYLEADQGILPPFAPGADSSSNYVENILKYNWSEQKVLYKAAPGLSGKYIYSGGVHLGYYGSDDILNGGQKMLLSWTAPTGLDPSTLTSEYQIPTAEITWA